MKRGRALVKSASPPVKRGAKGLLADVRELILATRQTVAQGVNSALVLLYWKIGERIQFRRGFSQQNMFRMVEFAEAFPDEKIVSTLSRELGWSHFVELLPLKKHLQRYFDPEINRRNP
jgi:hypothetical protein